MIRAVVDTNVLFEGLTKTESACNFVLKSWQANLFQPCISLPLFYEYQAVLSRKLSTIGYKFIEPAFHELLKSTEIVESHFSWRPSSRDPDDEFLIDCAMNGHAWLITRNIRDFTIAQLELSLVVLTPDQFIIELSNQV